MVEPEELQNVSFKLYQKHLDFIDSINKDNRSLALRTHLNSVMRNELWKQLRENIIFILFGLMFFMFALLVQEPVPIYLATFIGVVILIYGLIGGVHDALRRTR